MLQVLGLEIGSIILSPVYYLQPAVSVNISKSVLIEINTSCTAGATV